jgi:cytochrome c
MESSRPAVRDESVNLLGARAESERPGGGAGRACQRLRAAGAILIIPPLEGGAGDTWNAATLSKYLTNPRAMVPDTSMVYAGLKDNAKRADVVAYLATLH